MVTNFFNKIIDSAIPIAIISVLLLIIIIFIRIIFYVVIILFSKFYLKNRKRKKIKNKPKKDIVIYKKEEEDLYRNFETEKKKEQEQFNLQGVQKMDSENIGELNNIDNETQIVGIVKPIGFWTSLILGDQLSQILGRAQVLNNRSHKGFWVSMLEAQARGLGRQHGKER